MLTKVREQLDKLEKWAFTDEELPTWKLVFRMSVYVVTTAILEFVFVVGLVMTFFMLFSKFFIKDDFEE